MSEERPLTAFERRLHEACMLIPAGKCTSYGALAAVLETSPRAVGQALRRATWMPEIPAHRVIKASGDIGGFGGTAGLSQTPVQRKKALLEAEGLEFQGAQLITTDALLGPEELIDLY